MERQGSSPQAAKDILTGLGYGLFFARRERLAPLVELPAGDRRVNVFCLHRENPRHPVPLRESRPAQEAPQR